MNVFENVAFPLRLRKVDKKEIEMCIRDSLCIARAISVKPDILLMDEPASALDPIATAQLEETMLELKKDFTIIIVTHSMQQAARASDYTGFFYLGDLIEYDKTANIFQNAKLQSTNDYVTGHFG